MLHFTLQIAGIAVGVACTFESTRVFCSDYLCTLEPVFSVAVCPEDIDFERAKSAREDALEGHPVRHYSDAYLETLAVQRKITEGLVDHGILLFHGSVIAVDGIGYLFTAKSGTGKSTQTRLWQQHFGSRAVMVNDDKPFLRITPEGVTACGTPWMGKHSLGANLSVPLKAICILNRGEQNRIEPIAAKEAVLMLLQQSSRPRDARRMAQYMELVDRLSAGVRFYQLWCNMEPEAAEVAYRGMNL